MFLALVHLTCLHPCDAGLLVRRSEANGLLRELPAKNWQYHGPLGQAARRFVWSGPYGEEFAPDKYASAMTEYQAELLTVSVSGTSRRNVLGAIASEKNDCNFP